jgi:hypothetical protein
MSKDNYEHRKVILETPYPHYIRFLRFIKPETQIMKLSNYMSLYIQQALWLSNFGVLVLETRSIKTLHL